MIARVPGVTKPGTVCELFVSNMDLAATVLDIAGLQLRDNHDGRNLFPLFRDVENEWRDDLMCEFHGHRFLYSHRMVRWGDYKYIFNAPDKDELSDFANDPHELQNRIDDPTYQEVAKEGNISCSGSRIATTRLNLQQGLC
jgi:arylsulfatase A-like enzyme